MAVSNHQKRFSNWCRLGGARLRLLADLVEAELVDQWITAGYTRCETDPAANEPVPGNEIVLTRTIGDDFRSVIFAFDKYRQPAFQLRMIRRKVTAPHDIVFAGNLVSRATRYYQFWGKPWWWPGRFWPESMTRRSVAEVAARHREALAFLESGERNRMISKDWRAER